MTPEKLALLAIAIFIVAFLYSSVGHAGASGYIAVMGLFGLAPEIIRPAALVLNILVASIGFWHFWKAGHFSWRLFWPFAVLSIPLSFFGGYKNLPPGIFNICVGVVLLCSAAQFLFRPHTDYLVREPSRFLAIPIGAGLGLLAGLTGTGGGIFLTPLLLFMRWAQTKSASAVSALFILGNSISGLIGIFYRAKSFSTFTLNLETAPALLVAAATGGAAGSYSGSRRFEPATIMRLLAVVLLIAGTKLIFAH
jgi:hypothetical protein